MNQRLLFVAIVLAASVAVISIAHARDPEGRYADSPDRDWYRNAELTPEAQKRFHFLKCCDHADVVRTQFRVNKTTRGDEWFYMADGIWNKSRPTSSISTRARLTINRRCSSLRGRRRASTPAAAASRRTSMLYALAFAGGFAACWFLKDKITVFVNGVETEVRSLEDKIKALRAK